jgi:hypothetical protein
MQSVPYTCQAYTLDGGSTFNIIDGFDSTRRVRSDKEKPGKAGSLVRMSGLATPIANKAPIA